MTQNDTLRRVMSLVRVRQTRDFTDEPPTTEELDAICEVARWTGSDRNTQPWRFIVLRDAELLARIAEVGMPQTRSLWTATAAIAIAMPSDPDRGLSHAFDEGRVAERILTAATFLGLRAAVAWAMPGVRDRIGAMIGVPDHRFVRTIMAIGHPSAEGLKPKSPRGAARKPRSELVLQAQGSGR